MQVVCQILSISPSISVLSRLYAGPLEHRRPPSAYSAQSTPLPKAPGGFYMVTPQTGMDIAGGMGVSRTAPKSARSRKYTSPCSVAGPTTAAGNRDPVLASDDTSIGGVDLDTNRHDRHSYGGQLRKRSTPTPIDMTEEVARADQQALTLSSWGRPGRLPCLTPAPAETCATPRNFKLSTEYSAQTCTCQ